MRSLVLLAVLGGSIGAICGMKLFHHKTKKAAFSVGLPVILVLQIMVIVLTYRKRMSSLYWSQQNNS